jgi:hypothetical protein
MTNWVLIYVGKVVAVIEKEGNIEDSDFTGNYDSVAQDDSKTFKVDDDYTVELLLEYNREIWTAMGWLPAENTEAPVNV